MQDIVKTGTLSLELIDEFSEMVSDSLKDTKLSKKDILRFRLSLEIAMNTWLEAMPEGAPCEFRVRRRFGRTIVSVSSEGVKCDPRRQDNDEFGNLSDSTVLQSLGLTMGYSYENGINRVTIMPPASMAMQIAPIAIAIALGVGLALLIKGFFPDMADGFYSQLVSPVFDAMMNLLKTIAGPMIFLAVMSGIYGIGDISTLGKMGKQLIIRYVSMTYVCLFVALGILLLMVDVSAGEYTGVDGTLSSILSLVLQFIPTDIVSPFLNGNMLQIIFLATVCGIGMLILGEKVSSLQRIVDQVYSVVQLLMEVVGKLIPLFVFISLLGFVLSADMANFAIFVYPFIVIIATFAIIGIGYYGLRISIQFKVGFAQLMKKLLPTFLIALTTASSAAAFSSNIETCEKKLGIAANMTKFGVPLGQVVYMPLAAVEFLAISMILAQEYGVTITPVWIVTAVFVCGILAIATPPIPGGALSILTVMFLQLNIPAEALAIAISIDLLTDYIVTAGDISCLQEELVLCAAKTGDLDVDVLRKC